jgi:ATP-dependent DNA ligase
MIKYDGYWARAIITEDSVIIQSRGISTVTNTYGEYQDKVPHIVKELIENYPAGTVFLGEMCYPELNRGAKEVGSILRSLPDRAVRLQEQNQKDMLHFKIFDCLAYDYQELHERPFEERYIAKYVSAHDTKYVKPVELNWEKGTGLLEKVWSMGGEGIILINKNLPYNIGTAKAWHSIKVKRELGDLEAKVIAVIEPTKKYEGIDLQNWPHWEDDIPVTRAYYFGRKVGVVVQYQNKTINISSGITDEDGEYLATDAAKNAIQDGRLYAVFTGMEFTEDSVRHPRLLRLRDDI